MSEDSVCISCKKKVLGGVSFNCPGCNEKIIRCSHCRAIAARYVSSCGFTGPN